MPHDHDDQHGEHGHHHTPAGSDLPGIDATDLAECPVMPGSMTITADAEAAGLVREHNGQTYWLCCSDCARRFDAEPAAYAAA
ncbi:hypothetical protein [Compostimonas suwonensis]|uniref:YHS domain-containing protein n=1 Tax=Compostimonas suwonensis TaxID=1048394 RepID=A0A2M9C0C2_9MICO|nr:hypothetical protein [Compostimonas suwonensis]PJJ63786.1 hypothetical protein CLV54_1461 [Compostimonas suwonensis]